MGFDRNRFKAPVNPGFLCSLCNNVLQHPVEVTSCQHLFCKACLELWLQRKNHCPNDSLPVTHREVKDPPTQPVKALIAELEVRCDFESFGCEKFVRLGQLYLHGKECPFNPDLSKRCEANCGALLRRNSVEDHYPPHACLPYLLTVNDDLRKEVEKNREDNERLLKDMKEENMRMQDILSKQKRKIDSLKGRRKRHSSENGAQDRDSSLSSSSSSEDESNEWPQVSVGFEQILVEPKSNDGDPGSSHDKDGKSINGMSPISGPSAVNIPYHSKTTTTFNSIIACKGCNKAFPCNYWGKRKKPFPSPDYFLHCVDECDKYKALDLIRECTKCRSKFLSKSALAGHYHVCNPTRLKAEPKAEPNWLANFGINFPLNGSHTHAITQTPHSSHQQQQQLQLLQQPHTSSHKGKGKQMAQVVDMDDDSDESMMSANGSKKGPFICTFPGCGIFFKKLAHYNLHVKYHSMDYMEENRRRILPMLPTNTTYAPGQKRPFICCSPGCEWAFKRLHHLQRHHTNIHGNGKEPVAKKRFKSHQNQTLDNGLLEMTPEGRFFCLL